MTTRGFFNQLFSKPAPEWPLFVRAAVGPVVSEDSASEWYICLLRDTDNAKNNGALIDCMLTVLTDTLLSQNPDLHVPQAALHKMALERRFDMAAHVLQRYPWGEKNSFPSKTVNGFFVEAVNEQEHSVVTELCPHVAAETLAQGLLVAAQNNDTSTFSVLWNSNVDKHLALHMASELLAEAPTSPARQRAHHWIEHTWAHEQRHILEQSLHHTSAITTKRKL